MDFGVIGSHNEKSSARHLNTTKSIYMITVTNILAGVKKKDLKYPPSTACYYKL